MNREAFTYRRFQLAEFVNDGGPLTQFGHHAPHPRLGGLSRRQDRSPDAQIHFQWRWQVAFSKAGASQEQATLTGRSATGAEQTDHPPRLEEAALAYVVGDKTEAAYQRGDLLEKRARLMNRERNTANR